MKETNSNQMKETNNDQIFICSRFYEICEAMVEFKNADIKIPKEWLIELEDILSDNEIRDILENGIC